MAYEESQSAAAGEDKAPAKAAAGSITPRRALSDLELAYKAKKQLIEREHDDFRFALGDQWTADEKEKLRKIGLDPVVDNRIAPNLFLLTGLERQNRTDFKAFPIGEEDELKAEIATCLFKDAIRKSDFAYKSSDQFKDGITCGEAHLELYLDNTDSLINGKPCWKKVDGSSLFWDHACREYDFSDARYVYKIKLGIAEDDLVALFPEKEKEITEFSGDGKLDINSIGGDSEVHRQPRDYPKKGGTDSGSSEDCDDRELDLVERYYKKYVPSTFVIDQQTGDIKPFQSAVDAQMFVDEYQSGIAANQEAYQAAVAQHGQAIAAGPQVAADPVTGAPVQAPAPSAPPRPPEQDPERFKLLTKKVPEIWYYAFVPGMSEPLADERAWCFPKWKSFPFVPYFGRFSTAPLTGDERHLLIQGLVYGVKGSQIKHNKAEMLLLRHLNTTTNSGWLTEEDSWVSPEKVEMFGTQPGVNLEFKSGKQPPTRIQPMALSQGHAQLSTESAGAIKEALGINADLLATQQGGTDSGRAIALRQKQGLLMVQELFDNLSRTRQIAGRFLLSQLGEIYDTESAKKVLGEKFLQEQFPLPLLIDPASMQQVPMPLKDPTGKQMAYDDEMATLAIEEVLSGDLGNYDVSVGESVASETQKMSVAAEIKEIAQTFPGLIPPQIMVKHSELPESAKGEITKAIEQQMQLQAMAAAQGGAPGGKPKPGKPQAGGAE